MLQSTQGQYHQASVHTDSCPFQQAAPDVTLYVLPWKNAGALALGGLGTEGENYHLCSPESEHIWAGRVRQSTLCHFTARRHTHTFPAHVSSPPQPRRQVDPTLHPAR